MRNQTILLSVFNLINTGFQFLFIFLLSRFFLQSDYGFYRKFFLIFEVCTPLIGLGLSSSIFYFYRDYEDKNKLMTINLFIVFITNVIFCGIIFLFSKQLIEYLEIPQRSNIYLLPVFSFFSISNTIIYSFFVLEKKINKSIFANFIVNLIFAAFIIYLGNSKTEIIYVIYLRVFAYLFIFLLMISNVKLRRISFLDVSRLKVILKVSLPICISLSIGVISSYLDKIIVSKFVSSEDYAIYVNGSFEIPLISIVTTSISMALFANIGELIKSKELKKAINLFKKSANVSSLILYPCFAYFLINSKEFIILMFGVEYSESSFVFSLYLLMLPIRIIQYGNVLIALGKSKSLIIRSIIELLITTILSLLILNFFNYKYVVLGTVISVIFWTVPYNMIIIARGFEENLTKVLNYRFLFINLFVCFFISYIIKFIISDFFNGIYYLMFSFAFFLIIYLTILFYCKIIVYSKINNFSDLIRFKINL